MTTTDRAFGIVAVVALGAAIFAWQKWSDAEAVAGYYRSEHYKTCLQTATDAGATVELAMYRCHDDEASVKIAQSGK